MTKYHVTWVYENNALAMTDIIKASNGIDAHEKAEKIAQNFTTQDSHKRKICVGTITRLQ